jgi:glucosamine-6-phosphate deaminase
LMNINEIPTANNLTLKEIFPDENIDLSLRTRWASTTLERYQKQTIELVDQFCTDYEKKIRDMGGIGFFLGGIGPDGHIGFNVMGSDHYSTTRLIQTNYETQAAAATDLGGIEIAKKRLVITIGLDTITFNPEATAIIIAAGEAKGNIVRDSIQTSVSNQYPATVLQRLPNARFYLTNGAAFRLVERRYHDVLQEKEISQVSIERAVINLCLDKNKSLMDLNSEDYHSNKLTKLILERTGKTPQEIDKSIHKSVIERFEKGMLPVSNQVFLLDICHI